MTDRGVFVCPKCGFSVSLPSSSQRVFCRCGAIAEQWSGAAETVAPQTKELFWARLEVCESCQEYMGNRRCKRVGLGCRNEFRALLDAKEGKCPMEKW